MGYLMMGFNNLVYLHPSFLPPKSAASSSPLPEKSKKHPTHIPKYHLPRIWVVVYYPFVEQVPQFYHSGFTKKTDKFCNLTIILVEIVKIFIKKSTISNNFYHFSKARGLTCHLRQKTPHFFSTPGSPGLGEKKKHSSRRVAGIRGC